MRAVKSGSRMIIKNSLAGSSKRATQSVQEMIRTIHSAIDEERCEVKIDVTHSVWPWIAEHGGFLLTRFDVGRRPGKRRMSD